MVQITPKMVLDFILMVFHVSLWFASCKTTKKLVLSPFWEILSENGPISDHFVL